MWNSWKDLITSLLAVVCVVFFYQTKVYAWLAGMMFFIFLSIILMLVVDESSSSLGKLGKSK